MSEASAPILGLAIAVAFALAVFALLTRLRQSRRFVVLSCWAWS